MANFQLCLRCWEARRSLISLYIGGSRKFVTPRSRFPTLSAKKPSCTPTHQPIKGLNAEPGGKAAVIVAVGRWGG